MRIQSVDLVFLLDLSGGMAECIDSVKSRCCIMLNELIKARSEQSYPESISWRFKVCGYRNHAFNSENWFVDNPFVSDLAAAEAQFSGVNMQAAGAVKRKPGPFWMHFLGFQRWNKQRMAFPNAAPSGGRAVATVELSFL